jgi:hypothetical protein
MLYSIALSTIHADGAEFLDRARGLLSLADLSP